MKEVSNNEVAQQLREQERQQFFEHLAHIQKPKDTIIETVTPLWDGEAIQAITEPLYDFDYLGLQELWIKYGIRGQGAKVCVIDSGIDASHVSFKHIKDLYTKSYLPDVSSALDGNGHGTWVCGKIAAQGVGIAPRCSLMSFRTLDDNGTGTTESSTAALRYLLDDQDINLVNMSLGSSQPTPSQEKIINRLSDQGVLVVAAAGNFNTDTPFYPGSYDRVLTVAATDKREVKASFSNFGGQVDIAAPGVACYSTYLKGQFRKLSGTSMATPVITGILALGVSYMKTVKGISSRPEITAKILQALEATAKDLGEKGKDKFYGFGGINALGFLDRLSRS